MRWLVTSLAALLAAAFVGVAAVGGLLYWNRIELRGDQATRAELPSLANAQVPAVLGYDFQTIERSRDDVYALLTPDYRREYEQRAKNEIIPQARERELVSQISVVGVGVMDAHPNSGSVLVYLNRTLSDKDTRKSPLYDGSRIKVDYKRLDGKWLINHITVV